MFCVNGQWLSSDSIRRLCQLERPGTNCKQGFVLRLWQPFCSIKGFCISFLFTFTYRQDIRITLSMGRPHLSLWKSDQMVFLMLRYGFPWGFIAMSRLIGRSCQKSVGIGLHRREHWKFASITININLALCTRSSLSRSLSWPILVFFFVDIQMDIYSNMAELDSGGLFRRAVDVITTWWIQSRQVGVWSTPS